MLTPARGAGRAVGAAAGLLLLLWLALGAGPPAAAAQRLASVQPAAGAVLLHAPAAVVLRFGEPVDAARSAFAVYDASRDTISGAARVAGGTVTLPLGALGPGTYTLRWQAVAAGGQAATGSQRFSVWHGGPLPAAAGGGALRVGPAAARLLAFLASCGLVGAALLQVGLGLRLPRRAVLWTGLCCLAMQVAWFLAAAAGATGLGVAALAGGGYLGPLLAAPFGRPMLLQAAGAATATLGLARRGRAGAPLAALGSVLLVAGAAAFGPGTGAAHPLLGLGLNTLRLGSVAAWAGGLAWAAHAAGTAPELPRRLQPWALGLLAGIGVSGAAAALLALPGAGALRSSLFGRGLDVESALWLALLAAALRGARALRVGARPALGAQLGLGLALAAVAALLGAAPAPAPAAPAGGYFRQTLAAGALRVTLTVDPASAGSNEVSVQLRGAGGRPAGGLPVQVTVRSLDQPLGAVPVPLAAGGGGLFAADSGVLSMAGTFGVQVAAAGQTVDFTVPVAAPGAAGACDYGFDPDLAAAAMPWPGPVNALAVDPAQPSALLAGTGAGVRLTTDGGESWQHPAGPAGAILAVAGAPDGTWYAAGAGQLWADPGGGAAWRAEPVPGPGLTALLVAPWDPGALYAASAQGLARSADGGGHWTLLSDPPALRVLSALAADPLQPGRLYAGTLDGILVSADGGRSWSDRAPGAGLASGFAFAGAGTLWAAAMDQGLWVSRDGGTDWAEADRGTVNTGGMGIVAWAGGQRLLAGTMGGGLAESTDGGAHWQTAGCPAGTVYTLAAGGSSGGPVLWLGQQDGLQRLAPGGGGIGDGGGSGRGVALPAGGGPAAGPARRGL